MTQVVAAPFGVPAYEALAREVGRAQQGDPLRPVAVVVPSETVGVAARRWLARYGPVSDSPGVAPAEAPGVAGLMMLTLRRLANLVAETTVSAGGRRPVTEAVLVAATRRALQDRPGRFRDVADHPHTASAVARASRTLAPLPDSIVDRIAAQGEVAAETVRLHREIRAGLSTRFYGEVELLAAATAAVTGSAEHESSRTGVTGLPDGLPPVILFLPGDLDPAERAFVDVLAQHTALTVISGEVPDPKPTGDVVIAATDADDEVRAVVRRVAAALRSGTPGHRIAVLYGAADPYARLVHEHLTAAGIELHGRAVRPTAERVHGRAIRRLLSLPQRDFRRDEVMAFLADAPVRWAGEPVPSSRWERVSRAAGVVEGDDWQERLAAWSGRRRQEAAEYLTAGEEGRSQAADRDATDAEALRSFVTDVAARLADAERQPSWLDMATCLKALWQELMGDDVGSLGDDAERRAAYAVAGLLDRLAGIDDIAGDPSMSALREIVELELTDDLDRVGAMGRGVLVGHVRSGVGLELDLVCVVGLAEGVLPGRRGDDPLLPDRVRAVTDGLLPSLTERISEDHRAVLAALRGAGPGTARRPGRVLSFARGDTRRGGRRVPSRWLMPTLASLLDRPDVYATSWEKDLAGYSERHGHPPPGLDLLPSYAAELLASSPTTAQQWRQRSLAAGGDLPADVAFTRAREMARARATTTFSRFDGLVGLGRDAPPVPDPAAGTPLSATALEAWFACPHKYFVRHVLGVREVEAPEDVLEMSVLDRGSLVHRVLERLVLEWLARDPSPPFGQPWPQEVRDRLDRIADEEFTAATARGETGHDVLWHGQRRSIREDLRTWLDHDDRRLVANALRPYAAELTFGRDGQPPLEVDLGDGRRLLLRGSADRVDEGADRLVVLDYKTGKSDRYKTLTAQDPTSKGRYLQLPLYAQAARAGASGEQVVSAAYWFVSETGGWKTIGYDVDGDVWASSREVLRVAVAGIGAGLFPPRPLEHSDAYECTACDPDGLGERRTPEEFEAMCEAAPLGPYLSVISGVAVGGAS